MNSIRPLPSIADSHDFRLAVQNAPKAKALDGTPLVDTSFIWAEFPAGTWAPLGDVLRGYWP
jgi:hypothetical protein